MYFRIDKRFFADPGRTAQKCQGGRDTGKWREEQAAPGGARFNGALPGQSDLVLQYVGGDDTVFHMIELDRNHHAAAR